MALKDLGERGHIGNKSLDPFPTMAAKGHFHKTGTTQSQFSRAGQGGVSADHSRLLKLLNPFQRCRWGDADLARDLDIAHPAIGLQLSQDISVDGIEFWLHRL